MEPVKELLTHEKIVNDTRASLVNPGAILSVGGSLSLIAYLSVYAFKRWEMPMMGKVLILLIAACVLGLFVHLLLAPLTVAGIKKGNYRIVTDHVSAITEHIMTRHPFLTLRFRQYGEFSYEMEEKETVRDTTQVGDRFYLVVVGKKRILGAYNARFYDKEKET